MKLLSHSILLEGANLQHGDELQRAIQHTELTEERKLCVLFLVSQLNIIILSVLSNQITDLFFFINIFTLVC
jgi:hypothetical protein